MSLWQFPTSWDRATALIDAATGRSLTYAELRAAVAEVAAAMAAIRPAGQKKLCFLLSDNSIETVTAYLAGFQANVATALVNPALYAPLALELVARYRPDILCAPNHVALPHGFAEGYEERTLCAGLRLWQRSESTITEIHPELALLLTTSGSTGSPQLVRLTPGNIAANAQSITQYLGLTPAERPITSLPLYYSYGLSVLNSHLVNGATVVCSNSSVVNGDFWDAVYRHQCTSFAGVPYMYDVLRRLRFERMELPALRTLTQSGGRLSMETRQYVVDLAARTGRHLFLMYGQAEATTRISYVPSESLPDKRESIGIPIPGGRITVLDGERETDAPQVTGELVYYGPNVMLGYATSRASLAQGDEMHGRLCTGDLGYRDEDGFFYMTGRIKRIVKLFGHRVNLDEVEQIVERRWSLRTACLGRDDLLLVACEGDHRAADASGQIASFVCSALKLHSSAVKVTVMRRFPTTGSAKIDYPSISRLFDSASPATPDSRTAINQ